MTNGSSNPSEESSSFCTAFPALCLSPSHCQLQISAATFTNPLGALVVYSQPQSGGHGHVGLSASSSEFKNNHSWCFELILGNKWEIQPCQDNNAHYVNSNPEQAAPLRFRVDVFLWFSVFRTARPSSCWAEISITLITMKRAECNTFNI